MCVYIIYTYICVCHKNHGYSPGAAHDSWSYIFVLRYEHTLHNFTLSSTTIVAKLFSFLDTPSNFCFLNLL